MLISKELLDKVAEGEVISVENGVILKGTEAFKSEPLPDHILRLLNAGGLIEMVKHELQNKTA